MTLYVLACLCYRSEGSSLHVLVRQLEVTEPVRHYDLNLGYMKEGTKECVDIVDLNVKVLPGITDGKKSLRSGD